MYTFSHILLVILYFVAPLLPAVEESFVPQIPPTAEDIEKIKQQRLERSRQAINDLGASGESMPYGNNRIIVRYVGNINQPKVSYENQDKIRKLVDKLVPDGSAAMISLIAIFSKSLNS